MAAWLVWWNQNWFSFAQTLGIVGGLAFTGLALRRQTQSARRAELLTLTDLHRNLWSEFHRRADLARVLQVEVDFVAAPLTVAEEQFLITVIQHFNTSWILAKAGVALTTKTLAADAHLFFALPLPRVVWARTKDALDPQFVRFLEKAVANDDSGLPRKTNAAA